MPSPEERMSILNRLEKGEITPEQAAQMLAEEKSSGPKTAEKPMDVLGQLERGEISADEAAERLAAKTAPKTNGHAATSSRMEVIDEERFSSSRTWGWWAVPIAIGTVFTVLAGLWMAADARDGGLGLGFFCAWLPLSIGILLIFLGWLSPRGPWANVNVKTRRRHGDVDVNLNVPVPIGIATGALRTVGRRIPGLDREDLDKLADALEQTGKKGDSIQIQANDDDDDDSVDITIS